MIHRTTRLDRADVWNRKGLPVTSPARTLIDRAAKLTDLELENEIVGARRTTGVRPVEILAAIDRAPATRKAIGRLKRIVMRAEQDHTSLADTRSRWERRLLKLIADADLPRPITNLMLEGQLVDMVWLDRRIVIEFDSRRFHSDPVAFDNDRLRDARLAAAGFTVIRVTEEHLDEAPLAVIAHLAAARAAARAA